MECYEGATMNKEFVMRGQTASGETEILNFRGNKPGYGYRLVQFDLFPGSGIGSDANELCGTVTAGKVAVTPTDPDFDDPGLIASAMFGASSSQAYPYSFIFIINDLFVITQDLILMVQDTSGGNNAVNWQCKFEKVKLSKSGEAVANFNQFTIYDG